MFFCLYLIRNIHSLNCWLCTDSLVIVVELLTVYRQLGHCCWTVDCVPTAWSLLLNCWLCTDSLVIVVELLTVYRQLGHCFDNDEANLTISWLFLISLIWFIVLNTTFSNISAISWRPVLVVEEAGVFRENHRPWASNW
jgi:hypothetical protein